VRAVTLYALLNLCALTSNAAAAELPSDAQVVDRAAIEALGATVARRMRARHRAQRQGGSASTPAPMSP
jgi:hypothetical protein